MTNPIESLLAQQYESKPVIQVRYISPGWSSGENIAHFADLESALGEIERLKSRYVGQYVTFYLTVGTEYTFPFPKGG